MLIIFDENFPHNLAKGLDTIEQSNNNSILKCQITHPKFLEIEGIKDAPLIEYAGRYNAIIITHDKDFKDVKSKGAIYVQHKVGVFFFKFKKKEYSYWGIVKVFINQFEAIKKIIIEEPTPFVYEISSSGVQRFQF